MTRPVAPRSLSAAAVLQRCGVRSSGVLGKTTARNAPYPGGDPERHGNARALRPGGLSIFGTDSSDPDGTCVRDYAHVEDLIGLAHACVPKR